MKEVFFLYFVAENRCKTNIDSIRRRKKKGQEQDSKSKCSCSTRLVSRLLYLNLKLKGDRKRSEKKHTILDEFQILILQNDFNCHLAKRTNAIYQNSIKKRDSMLLLIAFKMVRQNGWKKNRTNLHWKKKRLKRGIEEKRKQMCRQYRIPDNSVKNYNYNKYNARFMSRHRFWVIFGNKVFFLSLSNALHNHDELQAWALESFLVNPDFSNDSQSATFFGYCS